MRSCVVASSRKPRSAKSGCCSRNGPGPECRAQLQRSPTQGLPVVRADPQSRTRSLDILRWGLIEGRPDRFPLHQPECPRR
jgi:putative SOS response-associated peptidase YedK